MKSTVIVVTGSSRGLGAAICRLLTQSTLPNNSPLELYATSRKGVDLQLKSRRSGDKIYYSKLDTTSASSISSFIQEVRKPVDILINNAGINLDDEYSYSNSCKIFGVNYRGTLDMCQSFLEEAGMKGNPGARIVNVTSGACMLNTYSESIQARFRDPQMTLDGLEEMVKEYLGVVKDGREDESGWQHKEASYSVSKACVNALTAVLARSHPGVLINCCCPGWVRTEMGSQVGEGGKKPEEGARIPVKLALDDIHGVSGRYWANDGVENTDDGHLMEW